MTIREKYKQNISFRVSVVCFVCVFLAMILLCSVMGVAFWKHQMNTIQDLLETYTNSIANTLDLEKVRYYLNGGEKDEYFYQVQAHLETLQREAELRFLYIFYPYSDGIAYIWDTDDNYTSDINDHDPYNENEKANIDAVLNKYALSKTDLYQSDNEEYGRLITCYRPICGDDKGNDLIAVVGADISQEETYDYLRIFEYRIIALVILAALVIALVLRFIISHQLVEPVKEISREAKTIVNNIDSDVEISYDSKFRNHDEIYDLGTSIKSLHHEIKDYIRELSSVTAEREKIGAELNIAGSIQRVFLPTDFPDTREYSLYALMDPAKEIGGDFYDFFHIDDAHLAIVAADVSGKGVPASLVMPISKTLIYDHIKTDRDLSVALTHINDIMYIDDEESMFVTVFAGILDLSTGEFTYVNAGHEPPFISRGGGDFELVRLSPQVPLGFFGNIEYRTEKMQLEPGDRIFQYTDGVTDATPNSQSGIFFGMNGIEKSLKAHKDLPAKELLTAVKADVDSFQAGADQYDDVTMICLDFKEKLKI